MVGWCASGHSFASLLVLHYNEMSATHRWHISPLLYIVHFNNLWYGAEACNATIMVCKVTFEQKTSMDAGLLSKHLGASLLRIAQQAMQTHAILLHLTGQSCQSPLTIAALATEITGT